MHRALPGHQRIAELVCARIAKLHDFTAIRIDDRVDHRRAGKRVVGDQVDPIGLSASRGTFTEPSSCFGRRFHSQRHGLIDIDGGRVWKRLDIADARLRRIPTEHALKKADVRLRKTKSPRRYS